MMIGAFRKFVAAKVAGHVDVHTVDAFVTDLVPVHGLRKKVDTYTITPNTSVNVYSVDFPEQRRCKVDGFKFTQKAPGVKGFRVKPLTKHDVKLHTVSLRRKINLFKGVKKVQSLPIELENKLKFQNNKPAVSRNEVILAWYWPIVDNAVIKLALDKQRGTLLVWYNPSSRHGRAKGLYLIRRLGFGEKPEWRWV